MPNDIGKRIKYARERLGISQTQLAKRADVSQGAISQLESGSAVSSKYLPQIAQALGVPVEQLTETAGGTFSHMAEYVKVGGDAPGTAPSAEEYEIIPQYDVTGSCGNGAMIGDVDVKGGLVFRKGWLEGLGANTKALATIYAQGDSMAPTIEDGQVLLVDTTETVPRSSKIYLVCIDGQLYIKRLINMFDGWFLRSDNTDKAIYPDIPISSEQLSRVDIQGRVIWKAGLL